MGELRLCNANAPVAVSQATFDVRGGGEIELETIGTIHGRKGVHDLPGGKSYSLATVARFLGWQFGRILFPTSTADTIIRRWILA